MCGKHHKGRQNIKTPNSGKRTRGDGRGGWRAVGLNGLWALTGALDRMSSGCYSVCWQIEHQ